MRTASRTSDNMAVEYAKDAKFFTLVHELTQQSGPQLTSERRDRERQPFECYQYVAPFSDGRMPDPDEFNQCACHDLSTGGFSFLRQRCPSTIC